MMGMDVAGDDRPHAERGGEIAQQRVPGPVASFVRTLKLDEEAVAAEGSREPRGGVRIAHGESVARAAGQADEPIVQLLQQLLVERRIGRRLAFLSRRARVRMYGVISRHR